MISPLTLRRIAIQAGALALVAGLVWAAATTAAANLEDRGIASGFAFLGQPAGYNIGFTLIDFRLDDSHGRVFLIGVLNTLFISALGIVIATALGLVLGVLRQAGNPLMGALVKAYVEVLRNIPLPLQVLFWYGLLQALPTVREGSLSLGGVIFLNNRGAEIPRPLFAEGAADLALIALVCLALGLIGARVLARSPRPVLRWSPLLLLGAAGIALGYGVTGITWDVPVPGRFNFSGGISILPAFVALLASLSLYTAAFIAEIVRAGLEAVPKGQREAALALGLPDGVALRRIVLPQALRVIVPPLTSQYLNLTKNSSLGLIIGYPDLMATFGSTTMSQTGQSIETIFLVMLFYLAVSVLIALFMGWYNRALALKER